MRHAAALANFKNKMRGAALFRKKTFQTANKSASTDFFEVSGQHERQLRCMVVRGDMCGDVW